MVIIESICSTGDEIEISAEEADNMVTMFEDTEFARNRFDVRRHWDAVSFTVAVHAKGEAWPFLSYMTGLAD